MSRDPSILSIAPASHSERVEGHPPIRIAIAQHGLKSEPVDFDFITENEALRLAHMLIAAIRGIRR